MAAKLYSASSTPAAARGPANILALGRGAARAALGPAFPGERVPNRGLEIVFEPRLCRSSFDGSATGAGERIDASMGRMHMKLRLLYFAIPLCCLCSWQAAQAREVVVPAGTLMTCTLDEPKFSSATVNVGDPFLCYPRNMQQFGQTVFPRGTYMVGHLEADKEPGHFVGKGYLKMAFDRIGLPNTDIPLTAKVVAVAGFNVDREGKIIGHGHATRDVVEWMLPPLWPWKVLTLPARGPRPALKGETYITLRLMEDVTIPLGGPSPGRFGEPGAAVTPPPTFSTPASPAAYAAPPVQAPAPVVQTDEGVADRLITAGVHSAAPAMISATLTRPAVAPPVAPSVDHTGWH